MLVDGAGIKVMLVGMVNISSIWCSLLCGASGMLGDDGPMGGHWAVMWHPCCCWDWVMSWMLVDGAGIW